MRQVEQAQRIICVGDSHCLPLRDVIFTPDGQETPIVIQSRYFSGFSAADMIGPNKEIGHHLSAALKQLNVISDNGGAGWREAKKNDINIHFASGVPACAPLIIVFCGDIDLRGTVFRQFNNKLDFQLPGDTGPFAPKVKMVSVEHVETLLFSKFAPIIKGVQAMHSAGLTRTYIAMITPPSLDDTAFAEAHDFPCPMSVRIKLTSLANSVLARAAAAAKIPFVEAADLLDSDGQLAEPFRLDGFHMTTDAAMRLIDVAVEHAVHNTAPHYNTRLYAHAAANAELSDQTHTAAYREAQKEFQEKGVIARHIDPAATAALSEGLSFTEDVGNRHLRLFWCGNSAKPFNPLMRTMTPTIGLLRKVHEVVYSDQIVPFFQGCAGSDVHFLNTRFFLSLPHQDAPVGPQTFHHDGCPPGMFRALIYLVDVDEQNGPFEYVGERGKKRLATGPAGTLLIFDANRLLHRGNPPRSRQRKVIDFCVAPRPLGFPRRVLWAGMNNWPMDPYQYPVEGMRAYPELEKKWVRVYPFAQQSPADAISFGQQSPVDPISERRSLRTMAAAFRGAVSKIGAR